ncbi:MAG: O-antigen ligase family protein [Candidatus Peribacteraceae bacterium]|nr:O-antigen ligase family protein [Candidatus Peribacteraceae bacterium]
MIKKYSQLGSILPIWGVIGGLALIALTVVPMPTLGFELPKLFVASVFASAVGISMVFGRRRTIDLLMSSGAGKGFLFFIAVTFASALWSVAPLMSVVGVAPRFQGVMAYGAFFTIAIFAAFYVRTNRGLIILEKGILLANLLVICYGVLQMIQIDPVSVLWQSDAFLGRIFSSIGHPNALGQFILLTWPFVIRRWTSDRRLLWGVLSILNLAVLLGTVSRSALLAAGVILILASPSIRTWLKSHVAKMQTSQAFILSVLTVLCICIGLLFFSQRFALSTEGGRSTAARGVIWSGVVQMVAEHPIGYGLETLSIVTPRFIGKELYAFESLTTVVDRAHSTPLQLMATLGPLGLLSYYLLVFALLLAVWKRRNSESDTRILAAGAALLGFTIATLFGFPSVASAVFFWVICGMLIGLLTPEAKPRFSPMPSMLLNVSLFCISLFSFLITAQWSHARILHESARQHRIAGDWSGSLELHQQGVLSFPHDRQSIMETAEYHLQDISRIKETSQRDDLIHSAEALITLQHHVTNGEDGMAHLLAAWLSALKGDLDTMESQFALAKAKLPESIAFHRTAAYVYGLLENQDQVDMHNAKLRGLLPGEFWDEKSQLRRILLKQHRWLERIL